MNNNNSIIEDFISAIILFNLIPLDFKIVFDDDKANILVKHNKL